MYRCISRDQQEKSLGFMTRAGPKAIRLSVLACSLRFPRDIPSCVPLLKTPAFFVFWALLLSHDERGTKVRKRSRRSRRRPSIVFVHLHRQRESAATAAAPSAWKPFGVAPHFFSIFLRSSKCHSSSDCHSSFCCWYKLLPIVRGHHNAETAYPTRGQLITIKLIGNSRHASRCSRLEERERGLKGTQPFFVERSFTHMLGKE